MEEDDDCYSPYLKANDSPLLSPKRVAEGEGKHKNIMHFEKI